MDGITNGITDGQTDVEFEIVFQMAGPEEKKIIYFVGDESFSKSLLSHQKYKTMVSDSDVLYRCFIFYIFLRYFNLTIISS